MRSGVALRSRWWTIRDSRHSLAETNRPRGLSPVSVEGCYPDARRDMADALKRFVSEIGVPPASVVTGVAVGPIDPALYGWFELHSRTILVDCTHPHRAEIAAHELGHALDAALLRAIAANAERALPPDLPRIGIKPEFDVPRRFASTDVLGMRDYENDGMKVQLRRLQSLSKSYAVNIVFERWIGGHDDLPGAGEPIAGVPPTPAAELIAEYAHYLKSPEEGFAELVRRYLYPRIRHGRKSPPCRFEAEHLDEFRRVTLPFIRRELSIARSVHLDVDWGPSYAPVSTP